MNPFWYALVDAKAELDQGDLIVNCPVVGWREGSLGLRANNEPVNHLRQAVEVVETDVVVLTQTCDLAQNKVRYVILCPHYALSVYRETWEGAQRLAGQNPSAKSWARHIEHIASGQIWNLALLNAEDTDTYHAEHRIVDFQEVLSLPREFLESWLQQGRQPRLRLLPPYREHLSQAFARFFMRVGLPTDIRKDW